MLFLPLLCCELDTLSFCAGVKTRARREREKFSLSYSLFLSFYHHPPLRNAACHLSLSCPLLPTLVKMSAGRHVRLLETGCSSSSSHAMSSEVGLRAGGRPSELSPPLWQTKDRSLVTTLQVAAAVTHLRDGGSHYIVSAGSRGSRLPETDAMAAGKTIYSLATESLVNDSQIRVWIV